MSCGDEKRSSFIVIHVRTGKVDLQDCQYFVQNIFKQFKKKLFSKFLHLNIRIPIKQNVP